jgi:ABC-type polysaccharide/polyol phosphate export permease
VNPEALVIVATLLWAFGLVIIGFTIYGMVSWMGWTQNIHDALLILVAFSSGVNAIATGALIDMHTMKRKD